MPASAIPSTRSAPAIAWAARRCGPAPRLLAEHLARQPVDAGLQRGLVAGRHQRVERFQIDGVAIGTVLRMLAYEGKLVRVGAPGLRSDTVRYIATEVWLGNSLDPDPSADARATARVASDPS